MLLKFISFLHFYWPQPTSLGENPSSMPVAGKYIISAAGILLKMMIKFVNSHLFSHVHAMCPCPMSLPWVPAMGPCPMSLPCVPAPFPFHVRVAVHERSMSTTMAVSMSVLMSVFTYDGGGGGGWGWLQDTCTILSLTRPVFFLCFVHSFFPQSFCVPDWRTVIMCTVFQVRRPMTTTNQLIILSPRLYMFMKLQLRCTYNMCACTGPLQTLFIFSIGIHLQHLYTR